MLDARTGRIARSIGLPFSAAPYSASRERDGTAPSRTWLMRSQPPSRRAQDRAPMDHSGSPVPSLRHISRASGLSVTPPSPTPHPSKPNSPCSRSRAAANGGGRAGSPRRGGIALAADGVVRSVAAMKDPTSRSNCCASRRRCRSAADDTGGGSTIPMGRITLGGERSGDSQETTASSRRVRPSASNGRSFLVRSPDRLRRERD